MKVTLMALISLLFIPFATADGGLRMAADGRSRVTVVTPQDAPEAVSFAGEDLVRCLGKALGVEIPTAESLEDVETPLTILVGGDEEDLTGVEPDGFKWTYAEGVLSIAGREPSGIANGVYTFLMDVGKARWFMPGELFEIIPSQPELMLPDENRLENPDFARTSIGGTDKAWLRRNRIFSYDRSKSLPFSHNLAHVIAPSKYGKEHPEYFAFIDGDRRVPESDHRATSGVQACFSNPEVVRITIQAARDFFESHPDAMAFSLCTNDSIAYCECPDCAALDAPVRHSRDGWKIYSDSYFDFVVKVADELRKTHPDKYVTCYAYWGTDYPPRHIERLPDNVWVRLTQDGSQHHDPAYQARDRGLWLKWRKTAPNLGRYAYFGIGWLTPRYYPFFAANDLKFLHRNGCEDFLTGMSVHWAAFAPQAYMASQLLWDVDLEAEELINEYMETLYEEAAPEMSRFYQKLEFNWRNPREGTWFEGLDDVTEELAMIDEDLIDQAWNLLSEARTNANNPLVTKRIDYVRDRFEFSYMLMKAYFNARRAAKRNIESKSDAEAVINTVRQSLGQIDRTWSIHENVWMQDPLYQMNYRYRPPSYLFTGNIYKWTKTNRIFFLTALRNIHNFSPLDQPDNQELAKQVSALYNLAGAEEKLPPEETIGQVMVCRYTSTPMKIDGDLSDWQNIPELEYRPGQTDTGEILKREDFHGTLRLAWDENNLYFATRIVDPVHQQGRSAGNMWQEDAIQFGIDPFPAMASDQGHDEDDTEIGFALAEEGLLMWRWYAPKDKANKPVLNIDFAAVRDEADQATYYETAIPWKELDIKGIEAGRILGFAAVAIDYKGSAQNDVLEWGTGIYYGRKDPRLYNRVKLVR